MSGAGGRGTRRWLPLRLAVIALVLLVALVVVMLTRGAQTGQPSGTVDPRVVTTYRGLPAGADEPPGGSTDTEPGGVVGEDGLLAVHAAGSSTCPWLPVRLEVAGDDVTVHLAADGEVCTRDLVVTTSVVRLPDGVDPDAVEVEVVLDR